MGSVSKEACVRLKELTAIMVAAQAEHETTGRSVVVETGAETLITLCEAALALAGEEQ